MDSTPTARTTAQAGADAAFRLDGRVALVTGSTAGIGAEIAAELARAGATVAVCSRRQEAAEEYAARLRDAGLESWGYAVDVRDEDQVGGLVAATVERFGGIDVLVNNAGGSRGDTFRRGPLLDLGATDLLEAYRLNVVGAFLCSRAAVPVMQERGGGVIVNVASIAATQTEPEMAAYGASKAALVQLGQAMATEWAPTIRVNSVCPGHIDTPRVSAARTPERAARLLGEIALGRMGFPEDVATTVRWLASPAASWMTGATITLDGGQRLY
jgi:NAD(P)-dependent dehydrogenase (short-subunit alcohol dehydrogenase family)